MRLLKNLAYQLDGKELTADSMYVRTLILVAPTYERLPSWQLVSVHTGLIIRLKKTTVNLA